MPFLKAADVISGQEGTITFNVEGSVEVGAYVKTFEATLEKQKEEIISLKSLDVLKDKLPIENYNYSDMKLNSVN